MWRGEGGSQGACVLVNAMVWPIVLYFIWHSFHERVQGNWPEPMYTAFAVAAAVAVEKIKWRGAWASVEHCSQRLTVPIGLGVTAFIYVQALFGIFPLGGGDPTARALGVGWKELAVQIDDIRIRLGAPIILTTDYGVTGWLAFYLPSHPPVEQIDQRIRFVDAPLPDPALFAGTIMYVCHAGCTDLPEVRRRFAEARPVTRLTRLRRGVPVEEYSIYRLAGPIGPPLDPP